MKKKKIVLPKIIEYTPYYETIMKNNIVYSRVRDILKTEKALIKNFENELKKKGIQFRKIKAGKYFRYYIIF